MPGAVLGDFDGFAAGTAAEIEHVLVAREIPDSRPEQHFQLAAPDVGGRDVTALHGAVAARQIEQGNPERPADQTHRLTSAARPSRSDAIAPASTDSNASRRRTKPEWSAVSDTVSPVKGARLGGLLARGLILGAAAVIVVVATLLTWPWSVVAPSPDQLRIADLQRLSHAIDAFRARQHVLPASLARLPVEPAAPFHIYDPVTNRPYDYRPLGPLAYELCARFDAARPRGTPGFLVARRRPLLLLARDARGTEAAGRLARSRGSGAVRDTRAWRPGANAEPDDSRLRRNAIAASCTFRATATARATRGTAELPHHPGAVRAAAVEIVVEGGRGRP